MIARNPLFFVFALPAVADLLLTLAGQAPAYWQDHRQANEMSPAYWLLAANPLWFVLLGAGYLVGLYWLVGRLRPPLNLMVACGFLVGHTWGSSTWLEPALTRIVAEGPDPHLTNVLIWSGMIAYFVLVGIAAGGALAQYRAGALPIKAPIPGGDL
jgi:hypothetical protein